MKQQVQSNQGGRREEYRAIDTDDERDDEPESNPPAPVAQTATNLSQMYAMMGKLMGEMGIDNGHAGSGEGNY